MCVCADADIGPLLAIQSNSKYGLQLRESERTEKVLFGGRLNGWILIFGQFGANKSPNEEGRAMALSFTGKSSEN